MIWNALDFGAASKRPLNSEPIQKALDQCSASGGGTVVVPAGTYRCGTIYLRSHVELHLEPGAMLFASENLDDYNDLDAYPGNFECRESEGWDGKHLIIASGIEDAYLTGPGTLHGNGECFYGPVNPSGYVWRNGHRNHKGNRENGLWSIGQLVVFCNCRNVAVTGLRILNTSCWSLLFYGCEDVQVRGMYIRNGIADGTSDGIDIDCCRNVTVSDCNIETGDDSITIRGYERYLPNPHVCENIVITNCVLATSSSAFRLGVGTGTIRHVEIGNCVIRRAGIGVDIQSSYNMNDAKGVDISHVHIHHLDIRDATFGTQITPGNPGAVSRIHDISFDSCRFESYLASRIVNSGDVRVSDVRFRDCDFSVPGRIDYFQNKDTGKGALEIIHADRIVFRDCRVLWNTSNPYWDQAIYTEDAPGLVIQDCEFKDFKYEI